MIDGLTICRTASLGRSRHCSDSWQRPLALEDGFPLVFLLDGLQLCLLDISGPSSWRQDFGTIHVAGRSIRAILLVLVDQPDVYRCGWAKGIVEGSVSSADLLVDCSNISVHYQIQWLGLLRDRYLKLNVAKGRSSSALECRTWDIGVAMPSGSRLC
jgi:hypothetical protein